MNEAKSKLFQVRVDDSFVGMLDDIRRSEPDLPTRAEMLRRLVARTHEVGKWRTRPEKKTVKAD